MVVTLGGTMAVQISASQMNQYTVYPHTKIIGGRFTFTPFQSLELGASRIMQWGGQGRPQSFSSFGMGLLAMIIPGLITNRVTNLPVLTLSSNSNRL